VRCYLAGKRILDVRGRRAQVDAVDSGDAVTFDNAGALRRSLRGHSFDEHAQRIATRARGAKLDA
jgi:hypothetical protein